MHERVKLIELYGVSDHAPYICPACASDNVETLLHDLRQSCLNCGHIFELSLVAAKSIWEVTIVMQTETKSLCVSFDQVITVENEEKFETVRAVAKKEGLLRVLNVTYRRNATDAINYNLIILN